MLKQVHNGRDQKNGRTRHVEVVVKRKRDLPAKPAEPARRHISSVKTIRPILERVFVDGEPGSNRVAAAFSAGLTEDQKAHITREIKTLLEDSVRNVRWRRGTKNETGLDIIAMRVHRGGGQSQNTSLVCEALHDLETNLPNIIATMT